MSEIIDYDWLICHSEEFIAEEDCGIIPIDLLMELMDDEFEEAEQRG